MRIAFVRRERASRSAMIAAPVIAFLCSILASVVLFLVLGKSPGQALYSLLLEPFLSWYNFSEVLLKMAPLLLIVVSVAGLFFGEEAARGQIVAELQSVMGEPGASAIQDLLASVRRPDQGLAATTIGIVLLLVGATTVFGELQDALDRIWRVPERNRTNGWLLLVRTRVLSFGMILAIGFLLMFV